MDEDGAAHIHHAEGGVAQVHVGDAGHGLQQPQHQQLEGVHLADQDAEADEDRGADQAGLHHVQRIELETNLREV